MKIDSGLVNRKVKRMLDGTLRSEKGFILILALVSMVAMTVIGISLIMNMTTDMQLARNEREAKLAFQLADGGINEAIARLRLPASNARYIGEPSPPAGTSNARTTAGWAGFSNLTSLDGLNYSVNITYLTEGGRYCDPNAAAPNTTAGLAAFVDVNGNPTVQDCTGPEVVMFGRDFNLDTTLTSIRIGRYPVYRILSTGTSGGTTRTIEAWVGASALNTDTDAGLNTNACVTVNGAGNVIESAKEGGSCGACEAEIGGGTGCGTKSADNMDTFLGGDDLDDIAAMANEIHRCLGATCNAAGDDIPASGAIDTIVQDWGTWGGTHSTTIFIDNEGGKPVGITGLNGRGILVVTGDIDIGGNVNYEGLIYVKGTVSFSGGGTSNKNIKGGVMAGNAVTTSGSLVIDYDLATLMEVGRQSSAKSLIVWRRL